MASNSSGLPNNNNAITIGTDGELVASKDLSDENLIPVDGNFNGSVTGRINALTPSAPVTKKLFTLTVDGGGSFETNIMKDSPKIDQGADFSQIPILNRSSNIITYNHTNNMTLTVTIELYGVHDEKDLSMIQSTRSALFSLLYPVISGIKGPPPCTITIGDDILIQDWDCVCTHVGQTYEMDAGWDTKGKVLPRVIVCNLSFLGVEDKSKNAQEIAKEQERYKDPAFKTYNSKSGSAGGAGLVTNNAQLQSALQNINSGNFNLNGFDSNSLLNADATATGLNIAALGVGAGAPSLGGANVSA